MRDQSPLALNIHTVDLFPPDEKRFRVAFQPHIGQRATVYFFESRFSESHGRQGLLELLSKKNAKRIPITIQKNYIHHYGNKKRPAFFNRPVGSAE
jgi:hypothetical protein